MFIGVDRFKAKELAEDELRKSGNLVKVENYNNKIGRSERTDAVIEPRLSLQWFLKMKELSKPALEAVLKVIFTFILQSLKTFTVTGWKKYATGA